MKKVLIKSFTISVIKYMTVSSTTTTNLKMQAPVLHNVHIVLLYCSLPYMPASCVNPTNKTISKNMTTPVLKTLTLAAFSLADDKSLNYT